MSSEPITWMKEREIVIEDYMKNQIDINSKMRFIIIDWMDQVCRKFKLNQETLYLSINILDRFLSIKNILRTNLQLVGITSILISAKFEEDWHGVISDFVSITDNAYTKNDIIKMEYEILSTLNFDIANPTAIDFLNEYLIDNPHEMKTYLCNFYLELTLQHYEFISFSHSDVALAIVYFVDRKLGYTINDKNVECDIINRFIVNQFTELLNKIHTDTSVVNLSVVKKYNYSKEIVDDSDDDDSDDDESDTIRHYNNSIGIIL